MLVMIVIGKCLSMFVTELEKVCVFRCLMGHLLPSPSVLLCLISQGKTKRQTQTNVEVKTRLATGRDGAPFQMKRKNIRT